jgi:uncharacterized RDD family membrane protein YckC
MISFPCPQCSSPLFLSEGQQATQRCPQCGAAAPVPQPAGVARQDAADELPQIDTRRDLFSPLPTTEAATESGNPYQSPQYSAGPRRHRGADPYAADRGERFVGALIDSFCSFLAVLAGVGLGYQFGVNLNDQDAFILLILGSALPWSIVQWVLISRSGQTVGKKAVGTRIIHNDTHRLPGFLRGVLLRSWIPALIYMIPLGGRIFSLIDALWIFGAERRCLHDLMANTKVVRASAYNSGQGHLL